MYRSAKSYSCTLPKLYPTSDMGGVEHPLALQRARVVIMFQRKNSETEPRYIPFRKTRELCVFNSSFLHKNRRLLLALAGKETEERLVLVRSYADTEANKVADTCVKPGGFGGCLDTLTIDDSRLNQDFQPHFLRILDAHWKVTLAKIFEGKSSLLALPYQTPGVTWEIEFWLSVLPSSRAILFFPGKASSAKEHRISGALRTSHLNEFSGGVLALLGFKRCTLISALFGVRWRDIAVIGPLSEEDILLVIGLRVLLSKNVSSSLIQGKRSKESWHSLIKFDPENVQHHILHQLWSELAALKDYHNYNKVSWIRAERVLKAGSNGRLTPGAGQLADDLERAWQALDLVDPEQLGGNSYFLTRAFEERRVLCDLLRSYDGEDTDGYTSHVYTDGRG